MMSDSAIKHAAEIIQKGGVVAFPTETVYGLGADATNEPACQKIFKIKGRPSFNPLIVHVAEMADAEKIAEFSLNAYKLAKSFWPGPLTLVLPLKTGSSIAPCVLAGNTTIALRIPAHLMARALIKQANCPIAAPSANPSGYISSTTYNHVLEHFASSEVFILNDDSGKNYGLESTIIDMSTEEPTILRYGFITPEALSDVLGKSVKTPASGDFVNAKLIAPGMLDKHYSPHTKIKLNASSLKECKIALNFGNSKLSGDYNLNLSASADLVEAAANLFKMLKLLDEYGLKNKVSCIAVAEIPNSGIGLAINDRLRRAATI